MSTNGTLKPLFNKVLLKREQFRHSSLVIPDAARKAHARAKGEVLAVGPDANESIKPGMTVVFGVHAGTWLDPEGNLHPEGEYFICYDEDILCEVINDDPGAGST